MSGQPVRQAVMRISMEYQNWEERYEWQRKGATLSDKTARDEFGLTQDEIYDAIDAGTLHYRQAAIHGTRGLGCSAGRSRPSPERPTATVTSINNRPAPSWGASTAR
jgi:hypothetical protein